MKLHVGALQYIMVNDSVFFMVLLAGVNCILSIK